MNQTTPEMTATKAMPLSEQDRTILMQALADRVSVIRRKQRRIRKNRAARVEILNQEADDTNRLFARVYDLHRGS